jgi:Rod binding domain-containing protein
MSQAAQPVSGVPVVNQALEPAWVRHGSASVQKEYAIAQQFEGMLVSQLARTMTETTALGGEGQGEEGGQAGTSVLSSMLPQALAEGVSNDGGLGLAAELTRQLQGVGGEPSGALSAPAQSVSSVDTSGGVRSGPTGAQES